MKPNRDYTNCACDPLSLKRYVNCTSQQMKAKTCDKADDILEANKTSIVPGFLAADAALNTAAIAEMAQLNKPNPVPNAKLRKTLGIEHSTELSQWIVQYLSKFNLLCINMEITNTNDA
uniref:Uncharacterized protein n=1 Tax=Glossina austeni TaxID=7395 RepID=A0A1A9UJS6_GLOAU